MYKPPSQQHEITVGFRMRRDQMPVIRRVAKYLRYKSVAAWAKAIFEKELNAQVLRMVEDGRTSPESTE